MPDLDAIRARADKATPGPWCWQATGEKDNSWALGTAVWPDDSPVRPEHGSVDEQENERWDETTGTGDQAVVIECIAEHYGIANNFTDADFIAHAREDILALLAEIERLRLLIVDHHAVGAYEGKLIGDRCPVCAALAAQLEAHRTKEPSQ